MQVFESDFQWLKSFSHQLIPFGQSVCKKAFTTIQKGDGSPVTDVDLALDEFIVRHLCDQFPLDCIVSEERSASAQASSCDRTWFIDPLDGTKEFIKGSPEWAAQIGLCYQGIPVLGAIVQISKGQFYLAGKGQGAFFISGSEEHKLTSDQSTESLSQAIALTSQSRRDEAMEGFFQAHNITQQLPMGSLGLKVAAIAKGEAHLYLNLQGTGSLWDTCAPQVLAEESGAVLCYSSGSSIQYSNFQSTSVQGTYFCTTKKLQNPLQKALPA